MDSYSSMGQDVSGKEWKLYADEQGRAFWFNTVTRQSVWASQNPQAPPNDMYASVRGPVTSMTSSMLSPAPTYASHVHQPSAPLMTEETLPEGWEKGYETSGRPFYIDHASRTTSWIPPLPSQARSPVPSAPSEPVRSLRLSDGRSPSAQPSPYPRGSLLSLSEPSMSQAAHSPGRPSVPSPTVRRPSPSMAVPSLSSSSVSSLPQSPPSKPPTFLPVSGKAEEPTALYSAAPKWNTHALQPACVQCGSEFTFFKRRHWCGCCAMQFCTSCCSKTLKEAKFSVPAGKVCGGCWHHLERDTSQCICRLLPYLKDPRPSLQRQAAAEINELLATHPSYASHFLNNTSLALLTSLLGGADKDLSLAAGHILASLVEASPKTRNSIADDSIYPLLVQFLLTQDPPIVLMASRLLSRILVTDESKYLLMYNGGLSPLLSSLWLPDDHVQETCAQILATMCEDVNVRMRLRDATGIPTLVSLLTSSNRGVVSHAIRIVHHFSVDHECRRPIFDTGGLDCMVELLKNKELQDVSPTPMGDVAAAAPAQAGSLSTIYHSTGALAGPSSLEQELVASIVGTLTNFIVNEQHPAEYISSFCSMQGVDVLGKHVRGSSRLVRHQILSIWFKMATQPSVAGDVIDQLQGCANLLLDLLHSQFDELRELSLELLRTTCTDKRIRVIICASLSSLRTVLERPVNIQQQRALEILELVLTEPSDVATFIGEQDGLKLLQRLVGSPLVGITATSLRAIGSIVRVGGESVALAALALNVVPEILAQEKSINEVIQINATWSLCALTDQSAECRTAIIAAGGVQLTIPLLSTQYEVVLVNALQLLASLSFDPTSHVLAFQFGAVTPLLGFWTAPNSTPDVRDLSAETLLSIATTVQKTRAMLIGAGGISAIVDILSANPSRIRLIELSACLIFNYSAELSGRTALVSVNAPQALISLLQRSDCEPSEATLQHATTAVANLAMETTTSREVIPGEAVPVLVGLLKHENDIVVQACMAALGNMARAKKCREGLLLQEELLEQLLAKVLLEGEGEEPSQQESPDERALYVLHMLSFSPALPSLVERRPLILKAIVRLLLHSVPEGDQVATLVAILVHMVGDSVTNRAALLSAGGIPLLMWLAATGNPMAQKLVGEELPSHLAEKDDIAVVLAGFPSIALMLASPDHVVQERAMPAVARLSSHSETWQEILKSDVITPLVSFLSPHDSTELRMAAVTTLFNLAESEDNLDQLKETEAVYRLLEMLEPEEELQKEEPELHILVCRTVASMARYAKLAEAMYEYSGSLSAFTTLLTSTTDADICAATADALTKLLTGSSTRRRVLMDKELASVIEAMLDSDRVDLKATAIRIVSDLSVEPAFSGAVTKGKILSKLVAAVRQIHSSGETPDLLVQVLNTVAHLAVIGPKARQQLLQSGVLPVLLEATLLESNMQEVFQVLSFLAIEDSCKVAMSELGGAATIVQLLKATSSPSAMKAGLMTVQQLASSTLLRPSLLQADVVSVLIAALEDTSVTRDALLALETLVGDGKCRRRFVDGNGISALFAALNRDPSPEVHMQVLSVFFHLSFHDSLANRLRENGVITLFIELLKTAKEDTDRVLALNALVNLSSDDGCRPIIRRELDMSVLQPMIASLDFLVSSLANRLFTVALSL